MIDSGHYDDQIMARLRGIQFVPTGPPLQVYDLDVPATPPLIVDGGPVRPYLVYYAPGGDETPDRQLADGHTDDLILRPMVRVVAGYGDTTVDLYRAVQARLLGWRPTPHDPTAGVSPIRHPLGHTVGTVRLDQADTPARYWLLPTFELTVTTTPTA